MSECGFDMFLGVSAAHQPMHINLSTECRAVISWFLSDNQDFESATCTVPATHKLRNCRLSMFLAGMPTNYIAG